MSMSQRCLFAVLIILPSALVEIGWGQAPVQVVHPIPLQPEVQFVLNKGIDSAKAQDYAQAIRCFEAVVKLAPGAPEAYYNLGLAESRIPGRELRAIGWLRAYLALAPDAGNAGAVRDYITHLDMIAESNANRMLALLKNLSAQFTADSSQSRASITAINSLSAALATAAKLPKWPPESSGQSEMSSVDLANAWAEFVESGLVSPVFKDIESTFEAVSNTPAASENQAWTVFAAAHAISISWLDRLAAVRQLGSTQKLTKSEFTQNIIAGKFIPLDPIVCPPSERLALNPPLSMDIQSDRSERSGSSKSNRKTSASSRTDDLDAKFRKVAEDFEKRK